MYADLHLHSIFSDGTDTPLELIELARKNGVRVISITDHDSVNAYKILMNEQIPEDIELMTGIEISIESKHKMIHILGYYIDIFNTQLENLLIKMSAEKTDSTRLNFEKAVSNGEFNYKWDRVLELNPDLTRIGGTAVVKAMEIDGYNVPGMSLWEMFHKYFWPLNTDYICASTVSAYEAIDIIKASGGISIIAHPGCIADDNIVHDLILHGVDGLEVFHPMHSEDESEKYLRITEKEKLYVSGGSDWHGKNNGKDVAHFSMRGLTDENYRILKIGDRFKSG